jgi:hypothetical protein
MAFRTDKETEEWLVVERRVLPMPDGQQRVFADFRVVWGAFDYLVREWGYTPARLVELTLLSAAEEGRTDIDREFSSVLALLDRELSRIKDT